MRAITILALLSATAVAANAQSVIRTGARVRVDAPAVTGGPTVATIISATPDSIVIASPDLAPLAIARSSIESIELSQGKDRWLGTKHGAVVGVEWGAGVGFLLA